jgi:hypothetical protein
MQPDTNSHCLGLCHCALVENTTAENLPLRVLRGESGLLMPAVIPLHLHAGGAEQSRTREYYRTQIAAQIARTCWLELLLRMDAYS